MPSNVFLYQLPEKLAPLDNSDKFLIHDVQSNETKVAAVSTFNQSVLSVLAQGVNFRIKNGNVLQIRETQGSNAGKYKTIVAYNDTLALSGAYET